MDTMNRAYLTNDALCIEVDRDMLESGASVTITVQQDSDGTLQIDRQADLNFEQMGKFLDRKCPRFKCESCPYNKLCTDWNEMV